MSIPRVEKGDDVTANGPKGHNRRIDQINRNTPTGDPATRDDTRPYIDRALFELTEAFTYPPDTDECPYADNSTRVWFDPSDDTYGRTEYSPSDTIYRPLAIRDSDGKYVGLPKGLVGERFWCVWNRQSARWEIDEQPSEQSWWGKLDDNLSAGSSQTASIWLGDPLADSTINVTTHAPPVFASGTIDKAKWVEVTWKPAYNKFYVTDWQDARTTTTLTVVTDYQYDTSTNKFQKKTSELTVVGTATASGWTDVHTATTHTVVSDYYVDGANAKFQKKTISLTTLEEGSESGWIDVHTGDTCS